MVSQNQFHTDGFQLVLGKNLGLRDLSDLNTIVATCATQQVSTRVSMTLNEITFLFKIYLQMYLGNRFPILISFSTLFFLVCFHIITYFHFSVLLYT